MLSGPFSLVFAQLYYGLPGVVRGANGFDPRAGEIVSHHVFKHLPMAVAVNDNDFPHLFRCVVDEQIEPKTGFAQIGRASCRERV